VRMCASILVGGPERGPNAKGIAMAKVATNYRFQEGADGIVRIEQTTDAATLDSVPTAEYNVEAQEADAVALLASGDEVVRGTGNARKLRARMIAMRAQTLANALDDQWEDVPAPLSGEELKRQTVATLKAQGATDAELVEYLISGAVPERFADDEDDA
jgi:hypothetical protein